MPPAYINTYKPPSKGSFKPIYDDPYDINFVLPIPEVIETERIKLVPFIPRIHAEAYMAGIRVNPGFAPYFAFTLDTREQLNEFLHGVIQVDPASALFAIIDKSKSEREDLFKCMAGVVGVLQCSPVTRSVEIGPVVVLPAFQHTYVARNAVGAMLKYWLDVPLQGGMGFRRVVWTGNPQNGASIGLAEKMGFRREGLLRWTWVVTAVGKPSREVPEERGEGGGRDSVILSLCWDDWEGGVRDKVQALIDAP
ncbi:hypothetical protein AMATHDRAFT_1701 [Amanita thiersii Skay4041]|uniref:N-acetyltransferase domain-containing protein n=1 Tax=Amanita thiersii Skay4041 TaxID=703135 RepID=A0A2A9NR00_9AGAR|nr:hypothetical protein AMATHDRAFT_1701 [Amanita thiersii Skay4041]